MSNVPSYPAHLTPEERSAVLEKAVRDNASDMSAGNPKAPASIGLVAEVSAHALVNQRWANDRIDALEKAVAELKDTK